jgi:hypothetical protein
MYLGFPPFSLWRKYITPKQQIWRDFSEFSRKSCYGMFFGTSNETKQTNQRTAPRLYILSYFLLSNIQILIMTVLRSNVADETMPAHQFMALHSPDAASFVAKGTLPTTGGRFFIVFECQRKTTVICR